MHELWLSDDEIEYLTWLLMEALVPNDVDIPEDELIGGLLEKVVSLV